MTNIPYTHQLQTTDDQFLDNLVLPPSVARRLGALRQKDDVEAVVRIVADHFRSRKTPVWSFYSHGSPWHETDAPGSVMEKADNLLEHRFRNSWAPHQWEDLDNGTADPDWAKAIATMPTSSARGTFVTELTTAFALTGDIKYARKALQLMRSFVNAYPFVLDPRFVEDHDQYFGGPADVTQTTSLRMFRWIDFLYSGAIHAPGVCSDADVFWVVKQLWFYTIQYVRMVGDPLRRDNHHLLDHGIVPFVMGVMFPEFSCAGELRSEGLRVMRHHCGHNLFKDGAYCEHSLEYQYHVLYGFVHPYGVAKVNGIKLISDSQAKGLRGWVEFCARCALPNGRIFGIGDAPGRPLAHLFGSLATPIMDDKLSAMAAGVDAVAGRHKYASAADIARSMAKWRAGQPLPFGVSDYFTAKPKKPRTAMLPHPATCQYPFGGYTFFRSDWSPQADYLAVSHFTGDYGGHAHWDPMHFVLHTKGRTLIGEPSRFLYEAHDKFVPDDRGPLAGPPKTALPYRGYSYAVHSHNCLVMNNDFLRNLEAMNHGTFWGGWPPKHTLGVFQAGGAIELAEVSNSANHPTVHRRFFVHVVGVGFVLVDLLSKRANLAPHQYAQYFHFEGDVRIAPEQPEDGSALRAELDGAACLIVPGTETESRWRTFRDPYVKDVYRVAQSEGEPWVAELTRRIRGQCVFMHFILTNSAADQNTARARYLGDKPAKYMDWQHEQISANAMDLGPAGTLLVASAPYAKAVETDMLCTDAELAVVHLDSRGKIRSWAMAGGSTLTAGGRKLAAGNRVKWKEG